MFEAFFNSYARLLAASVVLSLLASGLIPWDPLLRSGAVRAINTILAGFGQPTGGSVIEKRDDDWDCRTVNGSFVCTQSRSPVEVEAEVEREKA